MKRSSSCQPSVLNFLKSSSGTRVSPHVLLVTVNDDPDNILQFRRKYLLFQCHLFNFFCKFSVSTKLFFSLVKYIVWNHPPHFDTVFTGKSVLTYVASLRTT